MSDLLREVDDAMRQERMMKFWQDNAPYIIFFVVGTIALTGGLSAYKSWKAGVNEKQTAEIMRLETEKGYPSNLITIKSFGQNLSPDVRAITLMKGASAALSKKDQKVALVLYNSVTRDPSIPEDFRSLATLMTVRLKIDQKDQKPEALLATLEPIIKDSATLWSAHARLEAAVITANRLGDFKKAQTYLNAIQDTKDLPYTLYQQAQALGHVYSLKTDGKK